MAWGNFQIAPPYHTVTTFDQYGLPAPSMGFPLADPMGNCVNPRFFPLPTFYFYRTQLRVDLNLYSNGVALMASQLYDINPMVPAMKTLAADLRFANLINVFVDGVLAPRRQKIVNRFTLPYLSISGGYEHLLRSPGLAEPDVQMWIPFSEGHLTSVALETGFAFLTDAPGNFGAYTIELDPWSGRVSAY